MSRTMIPVSIVLVAALHFFSIQFLIHISHASLAKFCFGELIDTYFYASLLDYSIHSLDDIVPIAVCWLSLH